MFVYMQFTEIKLLGRYNIKGNARPDLIGLRVVVSLDRPWFCHLLCISICFKILNFDLKFLIRVQNTEPLNTKMPLIH
jgi:hypothetical protein